MQHLEDWARGIPSIVAIPAIQLVTFSDFMYEVLPQAKERRLFGRLFLPPDDYHVWLQMYQKPITPIVAIVNLISEFHANGTLLIEFFFALRQLQKTLKRDPDYFRKNPPTQDDVRQGIELHKKFYDAFFKEIKDELAQKPADPADKVRFESYLEENEQKMCFFFFIYVPSLLIYQTTPYKLYRQAIAGDIESIEKLLKLDPLTQNEPAIFRHIQNLRFDTKLNDYDRVTAAAHKLAVTNHSEIADARKNSKVQLAAIIQALSQFAGKRLTSTKIFNLFRAYARDKEKCGTEYDLPAGKSLAKAIDRHVQPWNDLFQKVDNKI